MRVVAIAAAALVLSGCGADAIQAPSVIEGFKAYRVRDKAGIDQAVASLEALQPTGAALDDPCSAESRTARRAQRHIFVLKALTRPSIMAMSEEARLLRLQSIISGPGMGTGLSSREMVGMKKLLEPVCPDDEANRNGKMMDIAEGAAILAGGAKVSQAWSKELKEKLGQQYEPRMLIAGQTLSRNGCPSPMYANR